MNSWIELIRAGFKDAMEPKMLTNSPLVISLPPVKPSFRSQHKEEVTAPVPGAPEGVDLQSFYRSETQEDPSQKRKRTDDETPHASQSSTPPNDQENVLTRPKRPREGDEHRPAAKRSRSDFDFDLQ
ncbi:MAG: uncharacterized protein KVP18_003530 [Porospora cf. gigantea A]|nr:MAG: hypothetical protein KVP18_003530 [Porospora cf. gigantea A]